LELERYQVEGNAWWLDEIPCLHRIHRVLPIYGAHKIQCSLGMSISLSSLEDKLKSLSKRVQKSNDKYNLKQKAILTFDDGHKDILLTIPLLRDFPDIQPVLFMTGRQLHGEVLPLPLTALYTWCDANNRDPNKLQNDFGFNRESLKLLPENEQRDELVKAGIDINPQDEEMLGLHDVSNLIQNDWLIGYHGHHHCDLRIYDRVDLEDRFKEDLALLSNPGYVPWIAWPEGRWKNTLFLMAEQLGFHKQFGLNDEKGIGTNIQILNRDIWK